ncbi:acetate--CoA ligase family protein [Cupriavidus basilensis]
MRLLADAGVPVAPHGLARNAEEAVALARRVGYPVVVKLCSAQVLHKSDVGGVALNLTDDTAVRQAALRRCRRHWPGPMPACPSRACWWRAWCAAGAS